MTRDEMIEKLNAAFDLGWQAHKEYLDAPRPDFSTKSSRRDAALAPIRAALRAPAVTSPHADALVEAQHRAERAEGRLREIGDLLEDAGVPGGTTIYGGVMMLRERAERAESSLCAPAVTGEAGRKHWSECNDCRTAMWCERFGLCLPESHPDEVFAAPPAAEAPPALVKLVQEWQEARKPATLSAPGEFLAETFQAAVRRMSAADEALAACRLDVGRACFLCGGTGNEGDEKLGDVDCHGCGGAGRVLPSLREELTEIIRWRFKTADGKPMNGPLVLKRAQEIANEIAPYIEEAVGER